MWRIAHARIRIIVFVAVGAFCFAVQLALLAIAVHAGAGRPAANGIGFALSAQVNFLLSTHLTWRDRKATRRRGTGIRWLAYNVTALLSLACNTVVFTVAYQTVGTVAAALIGVLTGTAVVYLTCNYIVFRARRSAAWATVARQPEGVS
jgi:putative flippase GtrA